MKKKFNDLKKKLIKDNKNSFVIDHFIYKFIGFFILYICWNVYCVDVYWWVILTILVGCAFVIYGAYKLVSKLHISIRIIHCLLVSLLLFQAIIFTDEYNINEGLISHPHIYHKVIKGDKCTLYKSLLERNYILEDGEEHSYPYAGNDQEVLESQICK